MGKTIEVNELMNIIKEGERADFCKFLNLVMKLENSEFQKFTKTLGKDSNNDQFIDHFIQWLLNLEKGNLHEFSLINPENWKFFQEFFKAKEEENAEITKSFGDLSKLDSDEPLDLKFIVNLAPQTLQYINVLRESISEFAFEKLKNYVSHLENDGLSISGYNKGNSSDCFFRYKIQFDKTKSFEEHENIIDFFELLPKSEIKFYCAVTKMDHEQENKPSREFKSKHKFFSESDVAKIVWIEFTTEYNDGEKNYLNFKINEMHSRWRTKEFSSDYSNPSDVHFIHYKKVETIKELLNYLYDNYF